MLMATAPEDRPDCVQCGVSYGFRGRHRTLCVKHENEHHKTNLASIVSWLRPRLIELMTERIANGGVIMDVSERNS